MADEEEDSLGSALLRLEGGASQCTSRAKVCPGRAAEWSEAPPPGEIPPLRARSSYKVGNFDHTQLNEDGKEVTLRWFRSKWQKSRALHHLESAPLVQNGLFQHYQSFFVRGDGDNAPLVPDAKIRCFTEVFLSSGL